MSLKTDFSDLVGDVWHRARWARSERGHEGELRDALRPVDIRPTGYRSRHLLARRWWLHSNGDLDRYAARARFDPVLDAVRIAARGRGEWLRLLYELSPEMHHGGSFTVSFDLSMPDGATRGLAWAAIGHDDDAGDLIIGQKFFTGMDERGTKALRFDLQPLPPGRRCYFVFCITSFPATIEVGGVHVTEHIPDAASPPPPPPPPPALDEDGPTSHMRESLKALSPSAAQTFWKDDDGFRKLRDTFWEQYYIGKAGLPADTSIPDAFTHFVVEGLRDGIVPNPLFDETLYVARARELGLPPIEQGRSVYLHWLTLGAPAGIVPTHLFDEEFYRFSTRVSVPPRQYFAHYLRLGFRRNFSPSQFFDGRWYAQFYLLPTDRPAMVDYALTGEAGGRSPHPWIAALAPPAEGGPLALERLAASLQTQTERLASPALLEQVEKAAAIEPRVMRPLERRTITRAPLKHGASRLWAAGVAMRKALKRDRYDAIVVTPHCRMAGSARVAGALASSLKRIRPDETVLLVTTELPDFERPDWFPDTIDILNLPELLGPRRVDQTDMLLLDLAQGLRPRRIFNINSPSGWKLLARFGRQLAPATRLYSYLFTWEIDRLGVKCGYPVVELQQCIDTLDACFVDNAALARETAWRYSMSQTEAERKLAVLWSPTEPSALDLSENFRRRRNAGEPMRCLWAGRFDRQKRLDIAVEAARLRPDIGFTVYGKPVLADGAVLPKTYPANMALMGVYGDLAEVGLERHDLFFYTSAWDGVPTVLLDIGARGVPVLASGVGGVGDLIDEETGWLVRDWTNPQAYLDRIDEMIADPDEVAARSRRLMRRIAERHGEARFDRDLARAMAGTGEESGGAA